MNKTEIRDIPGYEGLYQATNQGEITSLPKKTRKGIRTLKPMKNQAGYLMIILYKNGKRKGISVHTLIALCFLGVPKKRHQVNHIDGIKLNNKASNLEYITCRENITHYQLSQETSSEYIGVSWNKNAKKWMTNIMIKKKLCYLGLFEQEIDAANAYQNALNAYNKGESIEYFFVKRSPAEFTSKYKGIYWYKANQSWLVKPIINGKVKYIGYYKTENQAIDILKSIIENN